VTESVLLPRPEAGAVPRRKSGARSLLRQLGPGIVVAVAYVDPGNYATNVQAGAATGARLVWVVLLASVTAVMLQYLSAKLGAVTGQSLAQQCRDRWPRPIVVLLWLQAEAVAVATDVAEVIGGAVALHLLAGVPLLLGGGVTAAAGTVLLLLDTGGRHRFELVIGVFVAAVVASFAYQSVRVGVGLRDVSSGLLPGFGGSTGLLLATGIVGATVMPHTIWLHSALTSRDRPPTEDCRAVLREHRWMVAAALGFAAIANVAMVLLAARALPNKGLVSVDAAVAGLRQAGAGIALAFTVALLVSGLAASGVGTLAGDAVMLGFLRRRVPVLLRRTASLAPALLLLTLPLGATRVLVFSQVVLAMGAPFALGPLVWFTARRGVMGCWRSSPLLVTAAGVATLGICGLDAVTLTSVLR
jgi:manganese transport protein